jgi:DNA-binding Xre family transcriptional regulator
MDLSASEKKAALKALGARIETLIQEKFTSKNAFLAESGIYKATLHDITTGKADPQYTTLLRLAKALKVPVEDLVRKP